MSCNMFVSALACTADVTLECEWVGPTPFPTTGVADPYVLATLSGASRASSFAFASVAVAAAALSVRR